MIAAQGPQTLRFAARYGDGWNSLGGQPQTATGLSRHSLAEAESAPANTDAASMSTAARSVETPRRSTAHCWPFGLNRVRCRRSKRSMNSWGPTRRLASGFGPPTTASSVVEHGWRCAEALGFAAAERTDRVMGAPSLVAW